VDELAPEDAKILTLARSARARTGGAEGAAVRDDIGRTYAAATVALSSLQLSALQAAVAAAVSSGSTKFEAVAVVGDEEPSEADRALLAEVGSPVLLAADPSGRLRA
jgi:hypothetical protein